MKRIVGFIITLGILGALGYGIYKFFFDCKSANTDFGRHFLIENEMDYFKIGDEAIVKLLDIEDNRCLEEGCLGKGQFLVKLLVLNDMKIAYVELGSETGSSKDIDKLKYSIELVEINDDGVLLELNKIGVKK